MEKTAERPQDVENFRSFDVLASIDLYKFDLLSVGYVRPETKKRVYDEELSYVAEGINRPLETTFELRELNGQLVIFHNGSWQPYLDTLKRGKQVAERDARNDSRKQFLLDWATRDLEVGKRFHELCPGEQLGWYSEFPEAAYQRYGQKFIDSLGFQSARRLGFIYMARRNNDGSLTLGTKSVDRSDPEAFRAAMEVANKPGAYIDDAMLAYDQVLTAKHHERFYAGRRMREVSPEENAWMLIERHKDLIGFYFSKLEALAATNYSRPELELAKKQLTYGLWAAVKERLDKHVATAPEDRSYLSDSPGYYLQQAILQAEMDQAYTKLSAQGEVLFGCGGSMTGEDALLNASAEDVFSALFGAKSEWKKMTCPFCGDGNQWGDPCSSHQHCAACNARVTSGKVVSRGNGGKKKATPKE